MSASEQLHKLTDKAKEAEEHATTARQQAKADLEKSVNSSREKMEAQAARMRENAKTSQQKVSSWWDEQQQAWDAHIDKMHQGMHEKNVQRKAKGAEMLAEQAEADAFVAIDFAYSAIEAAEYAVLDAILERENADEAKATAASAGSTR